MKKLYISLLCISSMSLWGMEELTKTLEQVRVSDEERPAIEEAQELQRELEFKEIIIRSTAKELEGDETFPASVATQIGNHYKDLTGFTKSYSPEALGANKELLQSLVATLYEIYDTLIGELEEREDELEDAVLEYVAASDAEKVLQQASLMQLHDGVVNRYNALVKTTMSRGTIEIENDLPLIHAKITEARRAIGLE